VLLLTGDIERAAEAGLLAQSALEPVAVLLVPHHGSRTSSSPAFVAATRPRWALVASGHRNRWGFPKADVVERWQAAGAEVLVGSTTGAIEFTVDPRRPLEPPVSWRTSHERLWREP
jgi:competence protein ComEC